MTGEGSARSLVTTTRVRLAPLIPMLRVAGFVAAVSIVIYMGVRAGRDVKLDEFAWWPLSLALVASVIWWLLLARGWALLVAGRATRTDISVWCRTQALRFLPGGFWAPASRVAVVRGGWLDRLSTVGAENVIALSAAMSIGGIALAIGGESWWLALAPTITAPLVASRFLASRTRLSRTRTLTTTWNYLFAFAAYAVAAVFVQASISGFSDSVEVIGAATLAWGAGLLVVIAPAGVGVREAVYLWLLSGSLPTAEIAAGAVTLRVITIVAELIVLVGAARPGAGREVAPTEAEIPR